MWELLAKKISITSTSCMLYGSNNLSWERQTWFIVPTLVTWPQALKSSADSVKRRARNNLNVCYIIQIQEYFLKSALFNYEQDDAIKQKNDLNRPFTSSLCHVLHNSLLLLITDNSAKLLLPNTCKGNCTNMAAML